MRTAPAVLTLGVIAALLLCNACSSGREELILGATTSVQDPGLLDELVARFEETYDYDVKPIVGGSGQILEQARRGEMDVIMTHSPADEETLIRDAYAVDRTPVMRNFFLIAGPEGDPAGIKTTATVKEAFERIAAGKYAFVGRGDNSGTHKREQSIWKSAGIEPVGQSWYTESATGQGQNLLVANERDAYTLVDSSTFLAFKARVKLGQLLKDEKPNIYSVIRLNHDKLTKVNVGAGDAWLEFMTGKGQEVITAFGRDKYGQALFGPPSE